MPLPSNSRQLARLTLILPRTGRRVTEREVENGPLPGLAVGPDRPSVSLDDPLDGRQTDSGPLELLARMKALERGEHLRGLGRVETGSIIPHEIGSAPLLDLRADRDDGLRDFPGELERVRHQVLEHGVKQPRVSFDDHAVFDPEV